MAIENKLTQFIFTKMGVPTMGKYLDLAAFRHKLVSSNVANVSTPGYRSKDIDFEQEFQKADGKTKHLDGSHHRRRSHSAGRPSGRPPKVNQVQVKEGEMNSVDIDKEVSNMAQNRIVVHDGAKMLQRRFEGIKTAITSK